MYSGNGPIPISSITWGKRGLISTDSSFNNQNVITYMQTITASAILEPVRDLHIAINLNKSFGSNYSELYKDTSGK